MQVGDDKGSSCRFDVTQRYDFTVHPKTLLGAEFLGGEKEINKGGDYEGRDTNCDRDRD